MKITDKTMIRRNKNAIYKSIDGVVYLLNPINGTIHTLNKTASFIWEYLDKARSFKKIIDAVCENFAVARQTAAKDCHEFITNYHNLSFLEIKK